jgi:FtsZ-binding cell division protein ZapB
MVTPEKKTKRQKNGNVHEYIYYHYTKRKDPNCSQKSVQEYQIEDQLHEVLQSISLPDDFIRWALNLIKKDSEAHTHENMKRLSIYQMKLSKVQSVLDGLIEMRAGGEISEEEFRDKRSEIAKEKEALSLEINSLKESHDDWFERIEKVFSFTESAQSVFTSGTDQEKRELLSLLGSNLYLKDKKVTIEVKEPFNYIQEMSEILSSQKEMLEPLQSGSTRKEKEAYYTSLPKLLRE